MSDLTDAAATPHWDRPMPPDRDQLREALRMTGIAEFMVQEETLPAHVQVVREAARLVVEGREIWWCEEHDDKAGSGVVQVKGMEPIGMCHWYSLTPSEGQERCRMVRMILIDGGE